MQPQAKDQEMWSKWFTDNPFSRRRVADATMEAASLALPEAMRQVREATPANDPIDPDVAAEIAWQCGLALARKFTDGEMI